MKGGGDLHPARPDWWPPTKRPRATPGGLFAASATCLSRQVVPPCLRTSRPLGGTLGVTGPPGVSRSQGMHACFWYWGSEVLGCHTLRLESQSSAGLRMQPYPRSLDLVWPGHLHGTRPPQCRGYGHWVSYCCVAFAFRSGLRLGFVSVTLPALAGVLGGCVWVLVVVSPLFSRLGFAVSAVGLGLRPAPHNSWLVFSGRAWLCAHSACTPPLPVLACGVGPRAGVPVLAVPRHS